MYSDEQCGYLPSVLRAALNLFLRDRLIEQLTAELQALKEELESFRLEVREKESERIIVVERVV